MQNELFAALKELVDRCDGPEGVRADGSNIQTMRAHAALEAAAPVQEEPVAYRWRYDDAKPWFYTHGPIHPENSRAMSEDQIECQPLYTHHSAAKGN